MPCDVRSYALTFWEPTAYDDKESAKRAAAKAREAGAAPLLTAGRVFGIPCIWRGPDWYGLNDKTPGVASEGFSW